MELPVRKISARKFVRRVKPLVDVVTDPETKKNVDLFVETFKELEALVLDHREMLEIPYVRHNLGTSRINWIKEFVDVIKQAEEED